MAPLVDNPVRGHLRDLTSLLAPDPGRREFAIRQAVICALTVLVAETYQTPDLALTVYIVFFLNRSDRATSITMNGVLLLLMTVVIGLVLLTTVFVIDQPAWRVASMTTLSFGLLFLTSASKLRPLGATIALIVGYALDLLGTFHAGEIATRALLYAWLFVAIPVGISVVINLLIAPSPRQLAERALAFRLRLCATVLERGDPAAREELKRCLDEGLGEVCKWIKLAGVEKSSPTQDLTALHSAAEATIAILLLTDLATDDVHAALPAATRGRIGHVLATMAAILESGGYPVDISLDTADDESALAPLSAALLADLRVALTKFADSASAGKLVQQAPTKPQSGFFHPDAFTNPDHVRYALKTTGAAMFCYGLYTLLDWPGVHTCFLTCYIVALSTTAEAVEKLTLRILGCLVGAAFGIAVIIFVMPSITSIGALMAVVFGSAFIAAWVAGGPARIGYAGFQIAFAFFLCVIQGPAPAFDMVTARDRVIGILIGNVVSYVVFVYLWPVSVARRIDRSIGSIVCTLARLADSSSLAARRALAAAALAAKGSAGQDLKLLSYEPPSLRPSPDWVRSRSNTLDAIATLTAPLLLASDSGSLPTTVVGRLHGLAKRLASTDSMNSGVSSAEPHIGEREPPTGPLVLCQMVDRCVRSLEETLPDSIERTGTLPHAPL